jgi:hypothetical protein
LLCSILFSGSGKCKFKNSFGIRYVTVHLRFRAGSGDCPALEAALSKRSIRLARGDPAETASFGDWYNSIRDGR